MNIRVTSLAQAL